MQTLQITSPESLDQAVATVVRQKINLTKATATRDAEIATLSKKYQVSLTNIANQISELEGDIMAYCEANRPTLFPDKKSRETNLAVFGYEFTPWRVETTSRKVTWKDVIKRLARLAWGKAYIRQPASVPDKEALLTDREKLTPEQLVAAGIGFDRDEQFFIRPKPETASTSTQEAK